MARWHRFGSSKPKSLREQYKELQRLEKKEKEAEEKAVIQARIYEIKHKKRIALMNKLSSVGKKFESAAERGGSYAFKKGSPYARKRLKRYFRGTHIGKMF